MNGAAQAATSSQSSVVKTVQASAELFGPTAQWVAAGPSTRASSWGCRWS